MTLIPRHPMLRAAAAAWVVASVVFLVITVLRPEMQANLRTALSSLLPLYFLSFPLGHAGLVAVNELKLELYLGNHAVPGILAEGLLLWTLLTVLGYAQWFVLLPWISRKCRQLCNEYADRRASAARRGR
jgi:hypothetical protein